MHPYFLFQRKAGYVNPKLFVFFGESNSGGLAPNSSATAQELDFRNLRILNNLKFNFEPLKIGTNNLLGHIQLEYAMYTAHGMELQLANKYDEGYFGVNEVFLCKAGAGGSVVQDWNVNEPYFKNFKQRVIASRQLLNNLDDINFMLSIGINNRGVGTSASAYKEGLRQMIINLKNELNIENPKVSIMKFQFVTTLDMSTYNAVIDEVASEFNLTTFDTISQGAIGDGYHLNYAGMKGSTENFLDSLKSFD